LPISSHPTRRGTRRRRSSSPGSRRSRPSKERWDRRPTRLADALDAANRIAKEFQRAALYSSLMSDQDTRVGKYQGMQQEMQQVGALLGEQTAFIEPEILKIDKATLDAWVAREPRLKAYQHCRR
jgi:oligoendopeptidase F